MKKVLLSLAVAMAAVCATEKASAQCTSTIMSNMTVMCQGDTAMMVLNEQNMVTYQWTMNGNPIGTNSYILSEIIPNTGTHVFTCTATDNLGCTVTSAPYTITVTAGANNVVATNNGPVCAGTTLNLSVTGNNMTTYEWYGPAGFTSTAQNPSIPNVTSANSGTYYLYVNNGSGCPVMSYTAVSVLGTVATVNAFAQTGVCAGDTLGLHAIVAGITNATYSWTGPNSFSSAQQDVLINNATPSMAGLYSLSVSGTDCSGNPITMTDNVTITVDNPPVVTASSNGPICVGSTIQLNSTVSGATSFSWSGVSGFTSTLQNPTIPNAQSNNSGNYTITAVNGNCEVSETMFVQVQGIVNPYIDIYLPSLICEDDSIGLYCYNLGILNPTYTWSGPNGLSLTTTQHYTDISPATTAHTGTYTVTVTGNSCSGPVTLTDTASTYIMDCDSVWPGDANHDLIANYLDILYLGGQYGWTGPVRTGANISWTPQYCVNWNTSWWSYMDTKHADCNGDGAVNANDTMAVNLNYGQTHNKGAHVPQAKSASFPDLYFDMTGIALGAGGTFTIPIKLGTSSLPMNNVYGIGAEIKVQGITPTGPMVVDGSASWLSSTNAIDFTKSVSNNQTDWAFVRTNHTNVSGDGTIGTLTFTVPAGTEYQSVGIFFENVKIIDKDGVELTDYNVLDAGALVFPLSVGNTEVANSMAIVPNPSDAHAELQLSLTADKKIQVVVTDITGRNIWSAQHNGVQGAQSIALPAAQLASGMYTIQVRDEQGAISQTMKWIKK